MSKRNTALLVLASIGLAVIATAVARRIAERLERREPGPGSADPDASVMTLRPMHAFNEMRVLDRAGRYGWHSVEYGPMFHVVAKDDRQWEHARTFTGHAPNGEGWEAIGRGWGWWRYYARPVDLAALPNGKSAEDLVRG